MEMSLFFLTIFILFLFMLMLQLLKRSPTNLPPGPPKLPLIGNLHQLISNKTLPHRRLAELAAVYGPIMHLRLGEVPTVVISSPEMAKEVMKTRDAVFCSRPQLMVAKELFYGSKDIVMAPYGEYWRQVRRISVLEMLTAKRVESFRHIREEEVADLVDSLRLEAASLVNLSNKLFGLTFNITSRSWYIFFGAKLREAFNKKGKEQEEFEAFIVDATKASSGFSIANIYPSIKWLHSISGTKRKFKKLVQASNRILDPIIDEHKSKKRDPSKDDQEDLVDVLLKFHQDDVTITPREFYLNTNNIKAVVLELFSAGSETSSTVIEWAISELLKNPKEMEKAQAEVRRVYQGKAVVDERRLHKLTYLKLIIKETLRLHPPIPLLVPRESMDECQVHCYDIPSKTRVIVNAWLIGRDPEYWSEAERFNPKRFEDCSIDYKGANFELIPFGAGRRQCPGIALGVANIELPLATLLYHFDWKLPHEAEGPQYLNMDESFGITTRRKNDLLVIPRPCPYL